MWCSSPVPRIRLWRTLPVETTECPLAIAGEKSQENRYGRHEKGNRQPRHRGGASRQAVGCSNATLTRAFQYRQGSDPREMITAYAILKKAAAIANHNGKRLDDQHCKLIVQ